MKKLILISLLIPSFALAAFDRDLFYGLRNDPQVQELQEFLTEQGVYSGPITGNFFALTRKAVKSFQTANGVSSTGYFGSLTRAKANTLLSPVTDEIGTPVSPVITTPKTNDDVVAKLIEQITLLQAQLAELQKQQATLTQQNQKLQTIEVKQTEQQQTLNQIQQNTIPPTAPVLKPDPVKKIILTADPPQMRSIGIRKDGSDFTTIRAKYFEDSKEVATDFKWTPETYENPTGLELVQGHNLSVPERAYSARYPGTYIVTTTTHGISESITIIVSP